MGKYEEALSRARQGKPIDEIFPELKESEDDKTRKEIVAALRQLDAEKSPVDTYHYLEWADWLEKYEEQKPEKLKDDTKVGLDRALQIVKDAKGNLCGYQSDDGIYECEHAIQTLNRILKNGIEQKPAEWSEEDEETLACAISVFEDFAECKNVSVPPASAKRYLKRLKSLRPKPKAEWTIKDAKPGDILTTDTVTFIFKGVENGFVSMYCSCAVSTTGTDLNLSDTAVVNTEYVHPASIEQRRVFLEELVKHLFSLPHWKPSKEQMNELFQALIPGRDYDCDVLQGLHDDLVKLMEGKI